MSTRLWGALRLWFVLMTYVIVFTALTSISHFLVAFYAYIGFLWFAGPRILNETEGHLDLLGLGNLDVADQEAMCWTGGIIGFILFWSLGYYGWVSMTSIFGYLVSFGTTIAVIFWWKYRPESDASQLASSIAGTISDALAEGEYSVVKLSSKEAYRGMFPDVWEEIEKEFDLDLLPDHVWDHMVEWSRLKAARNIKLRNHVILWCVEVQKYIARDSRDVLKMKPFLERNNMLEEGGQAPSL